MMAAATAVSPTRRRLAHAVRVSLVTVGLFPFIPPLLSHVPVLDAVAKLVDVWLAFQCQRDSARSLAPFGVTMAACARCSGIYFGVGLGALIARPALAAWPLRIWVAVAALVMLLDVATEALGMRPAWAPLRLLTGIALAYPVSVALVLAARGV
jgi:uncharacterized membrane protein